MKILEILRYAYILIFGLIALTASIFIYPYFDNLYSYTFPLIAILIIIAGIKHLYDRIKKK